MCSASENEQDVRFPLTFFIFLINEIAHLKHDLCWLCLVILIFFFQVLNGLQCIRRILQLRRAPTVAEERYVYVPISASLPRANISPLNYSRHPGLSAFIDFICCVSSPCRTDRALRKQLFILCFSKRVYFWRSKEEKKEEEKNGKRNIFILIYIQNTRVAYGRGRHQPNAVPVAGQLLELDLEQKRTHRKRRNNSYSFALKMYHKR